MASLILPAISAGTGLLSSLRNHPNYRNPNIGPFNFTPDPNDPEIALRKKQALLDMARAHANTVNEIGRAGLLGSSAAFQLENQDQTQGNAALEDIPNSVYARQRQDALTLYRDNAGFQRQLALGDQGQAGQEHMSALDSLGSLGESLPYLQGLKKRALLGGGTGSYQYLDPSMPYGGGY